MVSFFGEIRPLLSRAVDDEIDDGKQFNVYCEKSDDFKLYSTSRLIIISVGELASIFVKSYFLLNDSLSLFSIKCSDGKSDDSLLHSDMRSNKNKRIANIATIFASKSGVLVCDIPNTVPDEICYETTQLLFEHFSFSQALILTSEHMSAYKRESIVSYERPFLRSLCSSQYMSNFSCSIQRLDPPNYLSGMSASLLQKCEIANVPALCVVSFVDSRVIDSLNVNLFDDILNEDIVKDVSANNDAKIRVLNNVKAKISFQSNLYT